MSIDSGTKIIQLNKYNTVYFCDHTFLKFLNSILNWYDNSDTESTIIRVYCKEICFSCTECHLQVEIFVIVFKDVF